MAAADPEHERGQRKGAIQGCDYDGCESERFNLVEDDLTSRFLVVCEDCGFTMGVLE